jgi:flagellar biosynthetic protein FliS
MNAHVAYLETEVATACPPKLRLLLIEAALRLAHQGRSSGEDEHPHEIVHRLHSLKRILLELLASIDHEDQALADRIKRVYLYLLSTVVEAERTGDAQHLRDLEKVLHVERETWQILTDRYLAETAAQQQTSCVASMSRTVSNDSSSPEQDTQLPSLPLLDCLA